MDTTPTKSFEILTKEEIEWLGQRERFNKLAYFEPYPKQLEFFLLSSTCRESLLMAGNQLGKTEAGAFAAACHLTGLYPEWWNGRRWDRPVRAWAAGETSLVTRDVSQKKLCGNPGVTSDFGTGYIPKDKFADVPSLGRGVTDGYDMIQVKHVSGGVSVLLFKSYEQGRTKFQGDTLDFVWLDEEPGEDIYGECITRITATKGMIYTTFTPLKGITGVVNRFINEKSPDRGHVTMTIYDAEHIAPEDRAAIIAGYPAHEREARSKGVPMLGSGRIFPYSEESITEPTLEYIPPHWVKLWGIDFGIGHAFAAGLIAWDKDNDVIHVLHTVRVKDQLPLQHAVPLKTVGANVPVAWPHDGTQREKSSGETLAKAYKDVGLRMLGAHATWPDGGNSTEAAVLELQQRMTTGRFKVAAHLSEFFDEFRMYHRKDGLIVKLHDDILSAIMKAIMMKRFAIAVQLGSQPNKRRGDGIAQGLDFDIFQV
jgi:phage terminase large subunit-like protein